LIEVLNKEMVHLHHQFHLKYLMLHQYVNQSKLSKINIFDFLFNQLLYQV
jgi:hypothetical protein